MNKLNESKSIGALFIDVPIPARIRLADGRTMSTRRTLLSAHELITHSQANSKEKEIVLNELSLMIMRVE